MCCLNGSAHTSTHATWKEENMTHTLTTKTLLEQNHMFQGKSHEMSSSGAQM